MIPLEIGDAISTASYDRLNDASASTTGALPTSLARISYAANWLDGTDRPIASANYGAISSFTYPSTPPSSSSTLLVSSTTYDNAGRIYQTTDPKGIITQMTYDAASRTTQLVEDQGGLNRTTNTAYTLDGQIAALMAVNSTTGDQITAYVYGTTLTDSGVARNDLLSQTVYPDAARGWAELSTFDWGNLGVDDWANLLLDATGDVTTITYNRLGEQTTFTDQRGTVRTFYYDKLGRRTNDCVSTVGSGTDNAVLQIATTFEVRGLASTITSTNSATPGSGTVVNQVQLTYNTFSQLTEEQQSHSGAVGGSTPSVQYAYDSGGSSSNEIRLNQLTYPNGRAVSYNFASGMDSILNRITSISDTSATLAEYSYLGASTVVRITYPQPSVWLDLWGGTSGTFNGFDRFNRIINQDWQNNITGTPADIDRYQYGYDLNSNRQWKQNVVSSAASVPLDEYYDYDNLNRLTEMQRGTLTGGPPFTGISGTPVAEQDWTLDATGNWSGFVTKASGTTTLSQTRTQNTVNEITAIGGTPGWATPPAYDPAGNMTSFPQPASPSNAFTAVYDAWNRMVSISSGGSTVATYQYDGRNFRTVKYTASISETRHFYYTNSWQDIEERVGTATTMDKQYVWGIRYVDELVCRDDATPQRLYACQDANFNLTAITDTSGSVVERYVFDPYGTRAIYSPSWTPQSTSSYSWVIAHQGLMEDTETGLVCGRNRYLQPALGRWITQDGQQYFDSVNLFEYVRSNPPLNIDPFGFGQPVGGPPYFNPPKAPQVNKCNPYPLNWHGCWCGPGPDVPPGDPGPTPLSGVDSCCRDHDECYGRCGTGGVGGFLKPNPAARKCDGILCRCAATAQCNDPECWLAKAVVMALMCSNSVRPA